jgi:glycosyltransferase involved in cell wall biosynthesis
MALGIPTIMSPVGVNASIINDGVNGFLASTSEEWVEKLKLLIEGPEMALQMGEAARRTVVERFSVEANRQLYLDYFNKVIQEKAGRV